MGRKTKAEEFIEFVEEQEQEVEQSDLPSVEGYYEDEPEPQEWYSYHRQRLSEFDDGDEISGKPLLLPVESIVYDEEEGPKYRCRLLLIDEEFEEYLEININLKENDDIQTNVHNASALYALIAGIKNLSNPQWTTLFNRIKSVNLAEWAEYINSKETMTIQVIEKQGNNFKYNSFRITNLS